jgi:CubicO group peptidase (beta-lactamase class C family)
MSLSLLRRRVACGIVFALTASAASAQDAAAPQAERVDALFGHLNKTPSPGIAVSVVKDGKVVFRQGYGLASLEHRVPITPSTSFDLASVSKQFTGLAVAMLAVEGKIRLSDDIRKYIPEMHDFGKPITIEHLARHTSGLRDWPGAMVAAGSRMDDVFTFRQILNFAYNQRSLNFDPGTEEAYSNTGYNVLAELVQRVTKRPFRAWMDEQIFRPLGMTDTRVRDDYTEVIPNCAFGYSRGSEGTFRRIPDNMVGLGSSSVFSTVDDLAKWMINLETAAVGGRDAMAMMQKPGALHDGTKVQYGFGMNYGSQDGMAFLSHSGGWASFNTFVVYFPQQRLGIAALANSPVVDSAHAAFTIADIFLGIERKRPLPSPTGPPPAPRAAGSPPPSLDDLQGLYRFEKGDYVRIKPYGPVLTSQVALQGPSPLSPGRERDQWAGRGVEITFRRGDDGKVTGLEMGGRKAERVEESVARPPRRLADYPGDYESEELGATYRIALKDGALELRHNRLGRLPLTWLWGEEFGTTNGYLGSIRFERDRRGRVKALVVNGDPSSRNVRCVRRR